MSARVRGNQVKIQEKGQKSARGIEEGQHVLPLGTLVTVDGDSSLELAQAEGGSLVTQGKASLVVGDGSKLATRVLTGKLRARAGKVPLEVEVPGGRILLMVDDAGGAESSVQVSKTGAQVNADRGTVLLRGKDGEERLSKGAQGLLSTRGVAVVEYHPPSMRDMTLPAGVSTTVHDPEPAHRPSRFSWAAPAGTRPRWSSNRRRAGSRCARRARPKPLLWFPLGTTAYRLRCKLPDGGWARR